MDEQKDEMRTVSVLIVAETWESGVWFVFPFIIVCLTAHPHEFLFLATSNRLVERLSISTTEYAVYPTPARCVCIVPRRTKRLSAPPWGIGYEGCDLRFIFQGLFPLI